MRIAFFSPMPPARSGIADYSAALLDELSKLVKIEVFESGARTFDPRQFDSAVYQIGNNPFHEHAYTTALAHPGVANSIAFPGLSINGFVNSPNTGIAFVALKPSDERTKMRGMDANSIVADLNQRFGAIQDAYVAIFPPPPVQGLGTVGGFKLYVEDRAGLGFEELYRQVQRTSADSQKVTSLAGLFSSFQVSVPQIDVQVDRV